MWSGAAFLQASELKSSDLAGAANRKSPEDGPILPTHRLLLTEFAFTYPPGGSGAVRGLGAVVLVA